MSLCMCMYESSEDEYSAYRSNDGLVVFAKCFLGLA